MTGVVWRLSFRDKQETCDAFQQFSYVESSKLIARQGLRLLDVALFFFTSLEGFAIPYFAVPNLGLPRIHGAARLTSISPLSLVPVTQCCRTTGAGSAVGPIRCLERLFVSRVADVVGEILIIEASG